MKIPFIIANELYEIETQNRYRRSVTIKLTPEQISQLGLKEVGTCRGVVWYETITDCFLEQSSEAAHE